MKLTFHGSAGEVGRSCIELSVDVEGGEERYLLDAGFKVHGDNPELPKTVSEISDIKGTLITHSHMDHIGAL
ncbi:MAG: MBL fold metallo-hydrolase, partial [Candidatus Woesearchaeota archaeon]